MVCLVYVQEEKGWLFFEVIEVVVYYFDMVFIVVYEVVFFYNMYDFKFVGRYKIMVCINFFCVFFGGYYVGEYVQKKLGIGYGEIMFDGKFLLKEGECMGVCGDVLVFIVNNCLMCSYMYLEQIDKLFEECK